MVVFISSTPITLYILNSQLLMCDGSFTIMVVDVLNGFGAMVKASFLLPVLKGDMPIGLQPGGMVAVIAVVPKAPVVVSALPSSVTPVVKSIAPLLQTIVPLKTE